MPIRVVLADDHPLILDSLENLLCGGGEFEVAARCLTGVDTLAAVSRHQPDVLLLDLRMPGMNGLEVLRRMRAEGLETVVVILTAAVDDDEIIEAVRLGVRGVVLKEAAPAVLIRCLQTVQRGGRWIDQQAFGGALERLVRREAGAREVAAVLTPREIEVVRMVTQGLRNREIADRLSVGEGTVKAHLHNIYEKLGIVSRLALGLYAKEKNLV